MYKCCFETWSAARPVGRGRDGATVMEYDNLQTWEIEAATKKEAEKKADEEYARHSNDANIGCVIRDHSGAGYVYRPVAA